MIQKLINYYKAFSWCQVLKHDWVQSETKRSAIIPGIKNIRRITFPIRKCKRCGKLEAHMSPITEHMFYHWVPYEHSRKALKVDKRWIL